MTDAQFRKTFMTEHAAVDPRTVPTVPKLLPPLPRASPTNKVALDQICFQWDTKASDGQPDVAMVCLAKMQRADTDAQRTNPFSGLYINYLYGQAACDAYTKKSQKGLEFDFKASPTNSQVDLGENYATVERHVARVCQPAIYVASNYAESWKDGTQSRFLKKYAAAAVNGDGVTLARDSIERMMKFWNNTD